MRDSLRKYLSITLLLVLMASVLPIGNIYANEVETLSENKVDNLSIENVEPSRKVLVLNGDTTFSEEMIKEQLEVDDNITVDSAEILKINEAPTDAIYTLPVVINGSTEELKVIKNGGNFSITNTNAIFARDVYIPTYEKELSNDIIRSYSSLLAIDLITGEDITQNVNINIEENNVTFTLGDNSVTKSIVNEIGQQARSQIVDFNNANSIAATNPTGAVDTARNNVNTLKTSATRTVDVSSWNEMIKAISGVKQGEVLLINLVNDFEITNEFVYAYAKAEIIINGNNHTINLNGKNASLGDGDGIIKIGGQLQLTVSSLNLKGKLPKDAVKNNTAADYVSSLSGPSDYDLSGNCTLFTSLGSSVMNFIDVNVNDVCAYDGGFNLFSQTYDTSTQNFYNVRGDNLYGRSHWGMFAGFSAGNNKNNFTEFYATNIIGDLHSGPLSLWETGYQQAINLYSGEITNNIIFEFPNIGYNITTEPFADNIDRSAEGLGYSVYPNFKIHDNWVSASTLPEYAYPTVQGIKYQKSRPANMSVIDQYDVSLQNSNNVLKTASAYKLYNMTPDANLWLSSEEALDVDELWTNNAIYKNTISKYGGIPIAELKYTDPVLEAKYANNGVAEGIHGDWSVKNQKGNKPISSTGNFGLIEKQINGKNYVLLVKSITNVNVKVVQNGVEIESGKYNYTTSIPNGGITTDFTIPSISDKQVVSVTVKSNVSTSGVGQVGTPQITPATFVGNETSFALTNNNEQIENGIYSMEIEIEYKDIAKYEVLANDALATSSEARAASSNINNKLIEWMKANVKDLKANTNLDDPSKIVVDSANINDIKAGTPGTYDVTFKFVDDQTVSKTVKLTIVDDSYVVDQDRQKAYALTVQNHMISEAEAKTITNTELIDNMVVSATMINVTDPQNPVDVKNEVSVKSPTIAAINTGGVTIHNVIFQVPATGIKAADAKLTVRPNNSIPTDDQKGYIFAQDAKINSKNRPTTLNDLKPVMQVSAKYDGVDMTSNVTASSPNEADILRGKVGSYPVTWTLNVNRQTKTVTKMLTIVDDNTTCDEVSGVCITANNFSINASQTQSYNRDSAITESGVIAWNKVDGSKIPAANIVVDQQGITNISNQNVNPIGRVENQMFSVTSSNGSVSTTVEVTIIDDTLKAKINGINAFVTKDGAKNITTDELIKQYMEVSAVNLDGNVDITKNVIVEYQQGDLDKIKGGVIGDYQITFKVIDPKTGAISATKTLGLHVVENEYTVSTDKQLIYQAHNLMMSVSEAQKFKKGNSYNMVQLADKFEIKSKFIDKTGAVLNTWGADNGNQTGNGRPKDPNDAVVAIDAVYYDNFAKNNDDDRVALSPWQIRFIIKTHNINVQGPGRGTEFKPLLTIRPDSSSPTVDNKAYIDAKDVTINKDATGVQLPNNIDDLKTIMQMVAKDDAGNDKSNEAKVSLVNQNQEADLFAHEVGTYQVIFKLDVGASVIRTLTIIDNSTTCDEVSGVCIAAQDFDIELTKIITNPTITENEIKTLAQVKAWSMIDGSDRYDDVVLDPNDYATITSQTTTGIVSGVTFSVPSTSATKDVTATIVDNANYTINADNFAVSVKDAPSLTSDLVKLPDNANVSVSPVGQVADVTVDSAQLKAIQNAVVGQYPLTLTYKGVTKEIKVTVYDDNTNTDNDADKDQAQIFLTADSQVKLRTNNSKNNPTLTTVADFNKDKVAGTNAKAWLLDGTAATVQEASGSQTVLDQPGLYVVKLKGTNNAGLETSVKEVLVSVVDDNTNCNDEVCISAQPIEILLSEASIYDEAMAKDRAQPIKAWYVNKVDAITQDQIKADASDIAIVNKQTTGTVLSGGQKFQVNGAKPLTNGVDVTITEDKAGSFTITGNNLKYHQDDAKALTDAQIKDDGIVSIVNANGVDVTSVMLDKVSVDQAQFATIKNGTLGTHDLKFTLNGSEATIKVTVYNNDTTTDVPGDPDASSVFLNTDKYIELGTNSAAAQLGLPSVDEFNKNMKGKLNIVATHSDGLDVTVTITPNSIANTAGSYKLRVSAQATDGTTAGPVEVVVLVKDENTICDGNVCLTAQNFNVSLAEIVAGSVNEAKVKQLAQVKGFDKQGNDRTADVKLDAVDLANINAQNKAGVVNDVTFTLGTATKDVTATILDDVQYTINAQDFAVSVRGAQSLDSSLVKHQDFANVSLSPTGNVDDVQVDKGQLAMITNGVVGKYPLTFTYKGSTKTINVTVYDDDTTVEPGKPGNESGIFLISDTKVELGVNKDAQALGLTSVDTFNQDVVSATNAKAWLKDGADATVSVVDNPVVDEPGRYVVKLKGTNNAGLETDIREVTVIVKDQNTTCNDEVCISAQPINLLLSEVSSYDEAMAKDRAKPIKAWYVDKADQIAIDQIKANTDDIKTVNGQKAATTLKGGQRFYVAGAKKLTTGVDVIITKDTVGSFVISASNNIVLSSDEAKKATSEQLRDKAGITITNANGVDVTATMIDQVVANASQLTAINTGEAKAYPLKFELNGSESNEIQVSVYDDNTATDKPNDKPNSELFLNADSPIELRTNNSTKYATLPSVDEFNKDVLGLTNANAYHKDPSVNVTITPTTANIADKAGRYTLTLTATATDGKTATKEIVVIVKDDNTSCNDKVCIVASDFDQNLTEVAQLTEDKAKVKANVKAFYIDQVGTPTVSVNQTQLGAIQGLTQMPNTNPMNLTFSAEGLDAPVKVTIVDNNYTLSANNFNVNVADLPLDEAGVVNKANATATNNATHALGTVKVDQTSLNKLNATTEGVVDVTLYVDEQPTVTATIKVNVVPDGAVVGDKATIAADSPIEINLSDVLKGDKVKLFNIIRNKANARAWYNDGTKPDPTIIYDENQMNNILAQKAPAKDLDFTFIVDGDNKAKKPIKVNIVDDTTITLPGQDGNLGTDDDVVVKPNPDGNGNYPTTKPDGSVDLPNGGDITFPNDPNNPGGNITVPPGSNVQPDGDVTTPEGDVVRPNPDGTIELPGDDGDIDNKPDNPVIKPGGNGDAIINPDGSVTPDDDSQITYPNNPNNPGGSITVPGGSTINPDGTVELPGEDKPTIDTDEDGTIILPGQDDELGTDDDVAVKPDGGNTTVNPDGSVTPDNDSNITFPNNPDNDDVTQVPGGSTINPDGTVETPNGGVVRPNPDGGVELPGEDGKLPAPDNVDNPVIKPEGDGPIVVNPDGSVTLPSDEDGEITFPNNPDNDDITQIPGGSTVNPDGTVETPNGGIVKPNPDGGVELPGNDGKLPAPDNVDNPVVKPEGDGPIVVNPDGSVTLPSDEEGTITYPNNPGNNGTVNIPGGSTVNPDGIVTPPNGGSPVDTDEDGSLKVPGPNGQLGDGDDVVVKPDGDATITPEGGIELPNGGTIVPDDGNGKEWPVNPGTVVNPDGSISLPGKNPQISFDPVIRPNGDGSISVPGEDGVFDENGDNDYRVEGPGITFDPETGNVTLPNGGTVTKPGGQQVTVPNGTIVLPDGTIIQPAPEMNHIPVITIKSSGDYTYDETNKTITIMQNTPFDVATIATANDVEDGDITNKLVINVTRTRQTVNGSVDTSIAPSEWKVEYSVTDSKGATARKNITVIVQKEVHPPVINGTKDQTIIVGSDLDLMAGVSANDYEGNDITGDVKVTVTDPNGKVSNDINTMIIGTHTVEYSVTDKNGLTTTVTQTVTVKPIVLPGEDDIPGTDDDVIVTPNPDGDKPTTDGDGNVTLPDGGDIEFPGGGGAEVPGDTIVKPGGEVIVPGGDNKPGTDDDVVIKPIPPTDEKPNGSIELPGDDGDIDTRPDNPVVTPEGPNKPIIKPDGGVELPDGGDITYPNNPDNPGGSIIVPPGSVVDPDGDVELPGGGQVGTDEDGTITLPGQDGNMDTEDDVVVKPGGNGDVVINPDGSVDLPDGGDITFPNNPNNPGGNITVPPGSNVEPDGDVTTPEGDVVRPNPDGTIELPGQDDQLGTDDDVIIKPGGNGDATIKPDGSVDLPNGGDISFPNKPDSGMEVPPGSNVGQDGTVTAPNGDQSRPNADGTITVPGHDNQFGTDDDGIITPNGPNKPVLNPDGTITLPDGGVIKFPGLGDCEIEILPGGHVASTGVVTNPGADGIINTADDEILDPAKVCAIEVTTPVKPTKPQSTHTGAMNNMIMLLLVIAISSATVLGLRRRK